MVQAAADGEKQQQPPRATTTTTPWGLLLLLLGYTYSPACGKNIYPKKRKKEMLLVLVLVADTAPQWQQVEPAQQLSSTCHYFSFPPNSPCVYYSTTSYGIKKRQERRRQKPRFFIPFLSFNSFVVRSLGTGPPGMLLKYDAETKRVWQACCSFIFPTNPRHLAGCLPSQPWNRTGRR
jgi:hypothetical protein